MNRGDKISAWIVTACLIVMVVLFVVGQWSALHWQHFLILACVCYALLKGLIWNPDHYRRRPST